MSDNWSRIFLLLASSDLSRQEIHKFCLWLDNNGPKPLEESIAELRKFSRQFDRWREKSYRSYGPIGNPRRGSGTNFKNFSDQIAILLLAETGLNKSNAVMELSKSLIKNSKVKFVQPLGKTSFRNWIERLARDIPENILLQEATKVRNKFVHEQAKSDWPLQNYD